MRSAARQLLRRPGFTLVAVAVLGLGIGVSTAMFSVLEAEFFRPLPYAHPNQLVTVAEPRGALAPQVAFTQPDMVTLQTPTDTSSVEQETASANLFATLGVEPSLWAARSMRRTRAPIAT